MMFALQYSLNTTALKEKIYQITLNIQQLLYFRIYCSMFVFFATGVRQFILSGLSTFLGLCMALKRLSSTNGKTMDQ